MTNTPGRYSAWDRYRASGDGRAVDCVGIVLAAVAVAAVFRPLQNLPFLDDWSYAWAVEWLLDHGELRQLEWSHLNVVQTLWGWLFCLPVGFSFTLLRLSTFVLGLSGLCAFYLLLRELAVARREALLGAVVFGVNPMFVMLTFTFMTDVPFLAWMLWASYAVARAFNTSRLSWFVAACGFAGLGVGTREISIAIPGAMALTVLICFRNRQSWRQVLLRAGLCLVPVGILGGLMWWQQHSIYVSADVSQMHQATAGRMAQLQWGFLLFPKMLGPGALSSTGTIGLALLPLALGVLFAEFPRRRLLVAMVVGIVLGLIIAGWTSFRAPLMPGSFWSLRELGLTQSMVPYYEARSLPVWWRWVMLPLCFGSVAIILSRIFRRGYRPREVCVGLLALGQFGLIVILWLFHDRYELVLVPLLGALLLAAQPKLNRVAVICAVVGLALAAGVGLRDHLQFNRALWQAVTELRQRGAADREIDGGYVVNGWLQYAHPDHAPRDAAGRMFIPGMTTHYGKLRYQIAWRPVPELRPLGKIPYRLWLTGKGAIYLYERLPDQG